MEPIPLEEGVIYRLTGTEVFGAVTVDGEYVGQYGSGLIFRNVKASPEEVGFRSAWNVEWSDLASIETPDVLEFGEEE